MYDTNNCIIYESVCCKVAIYIIQGTATALSQSITLSTNRSFMFSVGVPLSTYNNIRAYATLSSNGQFVVIPTASCTWICGQIVNILN